MQLGQRIAALRKRKHLTQDQLAEALGVKRARYNAWENGISNPDHTMLAAIAKYHQVSVDYLLDLSPQEELAPKLTAREERDIAADLERMIDELESDEALAFHGEPMDEETKELMRISLENSLRLAKGMAKQKFNPNKHK
ncbi:helix-turn-helix domain-containing protein [Paenibacillus humicola]|uniref:helix-turn-helix domain-containing protein n=1 Tax=Paenibacillus humicola TaxID=3110540 RepID=UPI00237A3CD2|nr:helix-turn-helix transcriptional regulator [Paenibacillus humicola]